MATQTIITLLAIGLAAGMLSGLVGVGGGIIVVPALVFFMGYTQQQAQGTSLGLLVLPVVAAAAFNYYQKGQINFKVVGIMAITFVAGGYLGSKLALTIPQDLLKKMFACLLLFVAFKLLTGK